LGVGNTTLEFAMNIEHDEVVVQDVSDQIASDDTLELAAGGAEGGGKPAHCGMWSGTMN